MSKILQLFAKVYGDGGDEGGMQGMLMKLVGKLIIWLLLTVFFLIVYRILYITQCTKPKSGNGTCFLRYENGLKNIFEYDLSQMTVSGDCNSGNPYDNPGQQADWIDTGFTTNGKQLIVYADGEYYPWGKEQTTSTNDYHLVNIKKSDGTIGQALQITDAPAECELNTNINYQLDDSQDTKVIYANQLNQYTGWNSNLRMKRDAGKLIYDQGQQADCITGVNCELGDETNINGCVLKHGAGIYMKIGNDSPVAYHIKNYFVPDFTKDCSSGICKLVYQTSSLDAIELVQVPFALPPVLYKYDAKINKNIFDIRDNVLTNLSVLTESETPTEYKFTTIQPDYSNATCSGAEYQKINGICYKQVVKQMTLNQMQSPNCPENSKINIKLANELCAPQADQKIWIKPADTCYDDNTGSIRLTFTSGVHTKKNEITMNNEGLKVSWVVNLINQLFTPFFGSQKDDNDPEEIIKKVQENNIGNEKAVRYCRNDGKTIYYSTSNKDWLLKTEKYGTSGLKIYDLSSQEFWDDGLKTTQTTTINYLIDSDGKRKCVEIKFKDTGDYIEMNKNKTKNDLSEKKITSSSSTLIRIANIQDGMFIQVRNAMMKSSIYQIARIMIVIWFIFSFGIGFLNRQKILSRLLLISSDWKRFLILLWCSDYNNYDLIDDLLWPALFGGSQVLAGAIIDAVSGVYGSSLEAENPLEFFDNIISSITSKELFYKLGAIATNGSVAFIMFFAIFPLLVSSIIDLFFAVVGPVVHLTFTIFNIGSIIMLMPIYALLSLFGTPKQKNSFTSSVKMLINEFIHFSFELGFFGFVIGFIHHYYLTAVDIKICWQHKENFLLLDLIPFDKGDWQICKDSSDQPADVIDTFKILWEMLKNVFYFKTICSVFGKFSITVADKLANVFAKGGNILGLKQADRLATGIGKIARTGLTKIGQALENKDDQKQEAEEMDQKDKVRHTNNQYNNNQVNLPNYNSNVNLETSPINSNNSQNNTINRQNETQQLQNSMQEQQNNNQQLNNNIENKESNTKEIQDYNKLNKSILRNKMNETTTTQNNTNNTFNKLDNKIVNTTQQTTNINNIVQTNINKNVINKTNLIDEITIQHNKNNSSLQQNNNQNHYNGAGIQTNNMGMQENRVGIQENSPLIASNDAGIQDSIAGKTNNDSLQQNNNQNHYHGAGIQTNNMGMQENRVGVQENNLFIDSNDAGIQDSIAGKTENTQKEQELNEITQKQQQIEKKQQKDKQNVKAIEQLIEQTKQDTNMSQDELEKQQAKQELLNNLSQRFKDDEKRQKQNAYNNTQKLKHLKDD